MLRKVRTRDSVAALARLEAITGRAPERPVVDHLESAHWPAPAFGRRDHLLPLGAAYLGGKRYHHAQNPGADTELIDQGEFEAYVRRAMRLLGGLLKNPRLPELGADPVGQAEVSKDLLDLD